MRRLIKGTGLSIAFIALCLGIYLGIQLFAGNFHEVLPGELYRSAQLKTGDIKRYHAEYHIATVLNLRGENDKEPWYQDELAESAAVGVKHIDFAMSASKELTDKDALALIEIMRKAPKPLLIHCHSGADRTGLASAFYMAAIARKSEWVSERQMWIVYGHVPFAISAAVAMNRTFERMEPYFDYHDT